MYSKVYSGTWEGIEGILIQVEADISNGLPVFEMVGYLSSEVKEAKERVRTALKNQGYVLPPKRITVNLAPAHLRKSGSMYDLAVGLSVLIAGGFMAPLAESVLFLGEVGLDGSIKGVQGVLPIVMKAREEGIRICVVPEINKKEARIANGICIIGVKTLGETVELFQRWTGRDRYEEMREYFEAEQSYETEKLSAGTVKENDPVDFSDIRGQKMIKRALEIAVSGHHNLIMMGSPGSGKSALAKRIPTIMPDLSYDEQLEITRIYSVCGKLTESGKIMARRPYRSPHHNITMSALTGGGGNAEPGEISLAHKGVLFLDELPEFKRDILDMMRQPMEEGEIVVSRNRRTCVYPADFMLVAAMNPCPCGYYPDRNRCLCSDKQIKGYQKKISGPLLDRIDMLVSVFPVPLKTVKAESAEESSKHIRKRVEKTRDIQRKRYQNEQYSVNANLTEKGIRQYCRLSEKNEEWLEEIIDKNKISYRGYVRILKLARTIADMDESENIEEKHLTEAVMFRMGWYHEE